MCATILSKFSLRSLMLVMALAAMVMPFALKHFEQPLLRIKLDHTTREYHQFLRTLPIIYDNTNTSSRHPTWQEIIEKLSKSIERLEHAVNEDRKLLALLHENRPIKNASLANVDKNVVVNRIESNEIAISKLKVQLHRAYKHETYRSKISSLEKRLAD